MKNLIRSGLLAGALVVLASTAHAGGDIGAGKIKSQTCMGCHGIPNYNNVYPTYHVPKLGGQHAAYIVAALQAYKAGQRNHETMLANSTGLSDQDMADIAAYFESIQ
jgi:cytochrome c553